MVPVAHRCSRYQANRTNYIPFLPDYQATMSYLPGGHYIIYASWQSGVFKDEQAHAYSPSYVSEGIFPGNGVQAPAAEDILSFQDFWQII
jgi:hypothetical protein